MTSTVLQTFNFRDSRGMTGSVRLWLTSDSATDTNDLITPFITALEALTNAHMTSSRGSAGDTPEFGYGSDAQYAPIEDKASLTYFTARAQRHTYRIPAPKAAIFMSDEQTVNPANSLVVAFNTAILDTVTSAFFSDAQGNPLTGYVGGIRTRSKLRRKFTIFTLNPAESGPGE